MARKKIATVSLNSKSAVIHWDKEWGEYVVRLRIDGVLDEASAYFTDDLDDAKGTAHIMLEGHVEKTEAA